MKVAGSVGAIPGIIDIATRSISTLADMRKRLNEANLTLDVLSSQLIDTRTALDQIHYLINESLIDEQHYSLVITYESTIKSCDLLIRLLDENVAKLEYSENDDITYEKSARLLLNSKGIEECQSHLYRQIIALNLLLTALQCRIPSKQKMIIADKQSQQVFERMENDTSSLVVLCDSDSFVTKSTVTASKDSKLSVDFGVAPGSLQRKAHKSSVRALMRRTRACSPSIRPEPKPSWSNLDGSEEALERSRRSATIDKQLQEDSRRLQREVRILVLGTEARQSMDAISHSISLHHSKKEELPSEADTVPCHRPPTMGIRELKATLGELTLIFTNLGGARTERRKWIHFFDNVTTIMFNVDLASYNEVLLEDTSQNRLTECIVLFESVVNSRRFRSSSIIVLLSNVATFTEKLSSHPLGDYFPDYSGDTDVDSATEYLLSRFSHVNRAQLNLYPHLVEMSDPDLLGVISAAVKDSTTHTANQDASSNIRPRPA